MIAAGINDWGGVSPVTRDHVNPEAPWPALDRLARETAAAGKHLLPRLAIYPAYAREPERWLDPALRTPVLKAMDAEGFARPDRWIAGSGSEPPAPHPLAATFARVPDPSPAVAGEGGPGPKGGAGEGKPPRPSRPFSTARRPAKPCPNPKSSACSRRAATLWRRSARRPTGCASGSMARPSAMS